MALDLYTVPGQITGRDAQEASALEWSDVDRTTAHTLPEGLRLLDYEIVGPIGEGGFGIVYLAWDHALEQHVAIKEYLPAILASRASVSPAVVVKSQRHREGFRIGLRSFLNEARILARFDHPSLVRVLHFWEGNGTAYMAMPYYEGPTLARALQNLDHAPDEAELCGWLRPLLDALGTMHAASCFHRDVSPDNILLTDSGPVLLDFGAARRVIDGMTSSPTVVFKPGFAPIEQYGEVASMKQGAWTDLYALAGVVYAAITGHPPTPAIERLMNDQLRPLTDVARGRYSESFLAAVDAALSLHPRNRPQSAAEFWTMLSCGEQLQDLELVRAVRLGDVLSAPPSPGGEIDAARLVLADESLDEEASALVDLAREPSMPKLPDAPAVPAPSAALHWAGPIKRWNRAPVSNWPPLVAAPNPGRRQGNRLKIYALAGAILVAGAAVVGYLRLGSHHATPRPSTPTPVATLPAPSLKANLAPVKPDVPVATVPLVAPHVAPVVVAPAVVAPEPPPTVVPPPALVVSKPSVEASKPPEPPAGRALAASVAPEATSIAPEPERKAASRPRAESQKRLRHEPRRPEPDPISDAPAVAVRPAAPPEIVQGRSNCTDLLQRASLGPLTPGDAAQLRKGCE